MEISTVNLDQLYDSLKGIIRPPLRSLAEVEEEPIILVGVKEFSYWVAKAFGWQFKGEVPEGVDQAVIIVAPHTSMFDFFIGMAAYRHFKELKGYYLAKQELFRGPFRWLFEKTGGIAVDRGRNNNLVQQVAEFFEQREKMFLALAPEGTRGYTKKWKSGFYRIALEAKVPIIMAYFDFDKREAGIGEVLYPSGDYEADAQKIESFYRNISPFWPTKWNWKVV